MKEKIKTNYKVGDLIYGPNIYDGMNTGLNDLPFYTKWFPKDKEAKILELCCGTGRLTLQIAKQGYNITGVDIMPSMLEQAKVNAAQANEVITYIEADIRHLDLHEKFDIIFIPFNSIHHLYQNEDLFAVFDVVKKHIKKDGLFLFDCYNPNIQYIVEHEKELNEIATFSTKDDRAILIKQRMQYEKGTQINRIEWHYFINGLFDSIQNLDMRMYYPQELDAYLRWKKFIILHKFGSFEEDIFHSESEKQIFVCQTI
ncbi:class I SAM-dependent methyltransferase [Flavobacterium orientale]|uniref:Methyltransferase n=1 Tax=Flavobacterium orientale TaxID=1756020 RepID=A0A916Y9S2_9FLAO|nr:class I SAM-dependent methyltransferase [Flavobacterium orientale]GGD35518.1 methyltransferase [Flavobacterium orientale]